MELLRNHNGVIQVESELGKGTTFCMYFPVLKGKEISSDSKNDSLDPVVGGNERILFVDDEEVITKIFKIILSKLGYRVTVMTDAVEAFELFKMQSVNFDLVITDMNMPVMNGKEFSKKLLAINPDLPIILCSGSNDGIDDEADRKIGIKKFIIKPVVKRELAKLIRVLLDDK